MKKTAEMVILKFILDFQSNLFSSGKKLNPLKALVQGSSLSTPEHLCSVLKNLYSSSVIELKKKKGPKNNPTKKTLEVYRRHEAGGKAVQLS